VDVEVTLQDRGGKEQRVTLRTMLPGLPQLIAVGESSDITRALAEAKHELIRQLEHQKSAREPMSNRRLRRATIRRATAFAPSTPSIPNATEPRVIGNHAQMGMRPNVRRTEMVAAQSTWDSEGGAQQRP
jgi:hypothetical protein